MDSPTDSDEHKQEPPSVRFSTVVIREYSRILGNNPAVRQGPPLSIGWDYQEFATMDLNQYEQKRSALRHAREMIIPEQLRIDILRENGYSMQEIIRLTRPVNIARSQRERTNQMLHMKPVEEVFESAVRKVKNIASLGSRKRRERELLKKFQSGSCHQKSTADPTEPKHISHLHESVFLALNDSVHGKKFVF